MTSATPDPGDLRPIPRPDRRWMVVPILLVVGLAVAVAKPWGGDRSTVTPSASLAALPTATATAAAVVSPPTVPTRALLAVGSLVNLIDLGSVPWSNEMTADQGGIWVWSDAGIVWRIRAGTDTVTRIDLDGTPTEAGPLGSRGVAVAGSQVWVSDPGHRGLARIDRETESVAERIELWSADAAVSVAEQGTTRDRWASAWGFAIDGDSIFVPSIAARPGDVIDPAPADGQLWRVDTTSGQPPGWISIDHPTGVAVGFGSVWVVSCCGDHSDTRTYSIVRLEEETGGIQASITLPVPEAKAEGRPVVRVGPDSVWVGLAELPAVVRIDPATNSVRSVLPTELPVSDIAIGDDGSVWVTEAEAWYSFGAALSDRCEGRLVRIDPATERVAAAMDMTCPMSVAVSGDDVWVGSVGTEPRSTGGRPPMLIHLRAIDPPP